MSRIRRVAGNALSSYGRGLVTIAVLVYLTPAIINYAGEEDFGLWSLTFAILGILGLLDMAGMAGVVKWVAECRGSGDVERRNRILSTVACVYLGISVVALIALTGFAWSYHELFDIPAHLRGKATVLLWILAIRQVILAVPLLLFKGILFGEQRIVLVNGIQTGGVVLYGVAGYMVLYRGAGIVGLAWVNLATMLVEHLAYLVLSFRCVPDLRMSPRLADRSLLGEVFSFSAAQLVINVSALIRLRTDLILVRFLVSLALVPVYAIALRLTEVTYYLIKQFVNVLAPLKVQLAAAGDGDGLRAILIHVAKIALVPVVMATSAAFVVGEQAIVFWVGPEFADAAPLLCILMSSLVVGVPPLLAFTLLGMTGEHSLTARAAAASIALNLAASALLWWRLGIVGIALGTLVATVLIDFCVILRRACRRHGLSLAIQLVRVYVPALGPGFVQAAVTYGVVAWWPPTGLITVVLAAVPGAAVYLAVFWLWATEPIERASVREILAGRRSRRA